MRWLKKLAVPLVSLGTATACHESDTIAPPATVHFVIDAPLCSSIIPVQFFIDRTPVGVDTFRVHVAGEHTISRAFTTTSGLHVLGASVTEGYVWPDKAITLLPGQAFADSLPFYCS